jgi:hypothetical protein
MSYHKVFAAPFQNYTGSALAFFTEKFFELR